MSDSLSTSRDTLFSVGFTAVLGLIALTVISVMAGRLLIEGLGLHAPWPGYADTVANLHNLSARIRWLLGDLSEVAFYKHEFASIGLLAGGALAWWGNVQGKRWQGFAICYGTGLWPWLVTSSLLGVLLGNLLWGWTLSAGGWQPTFVAFVSVPAAMVLMFGGGWKVAINGAWLGALLVTPASLLIVNYVCNPLQWPVVIGNVSGMAIASVVVFGLCRALPMLVVSRQPYATVAPPPQRAPDYGLRWMLRRTLADFSEGPFFGNEWASLGLILGALLAFGLNPASPFYGSGWLPELLAAQALASALGIVVWRRRWIEHGWYPTYIPIVSVVPATLLVHGNSLSVMAISAVLGALLAPPLAAAISRRLPAHQHGYIGNVCSMAISTLLIVPMTGALVSTF